MGTNISSIRVRNADGFGVFPADLPDLSGEECPCSWQPPSPAPESVRGPWHTDEAGFATLRQVVPWAPQHEFTFPWYGDWSGQVFDVLKERVLPAFKGRADLFISWDDDTCCGLRVVDGKVTEHEVIQTLGAER
jgi:hypothetical protein